MKRPFAASVWKEGDWYVSQCLEIDVASQGETEEEALANLKEALELYFEPRRPLPRDQAPFGSIAKVIPKFWGIQSVTHGNSGQILT